MAASDTLVFDSTRFGNAQNLDIVLEITADAGTPNPDTNRDSSS